MKKRSRRRAVSSRHGFSKTLSEAEGSRAEKAEQREGAFRSEAKPSGDPERSPRSGAEPKGAPEGTVRLFDDSHAAPPPACITATIDGAARGNPGPASYGVVFADSNGKVLAQLSAKLGRATNNVAEYRALLAALTHAREQGWRALRVRTDSELLANQIRGRFKVKNPDLRLLHAEAHRLAAAFDFFSIEAVPRRYTRAADKLANAALDGRPAPSLSRAKPRDAADKLANAALDGRPAISRQPSARASGTTGGHGFSRAERDAKKERALAPEGKQTIRALYQDGVLKPLEPLDLPNGTEVEVEVTCHRRK